MNRYSRPVAVALFLLALPAGSALAQSKDETTVLDSWATGLPGGGFIPHVRFQIVNGGGDDYLLSFQFRYQDRKDFPSVQRRNREDYNYDLPRIIPPDVPEKVVWNNLNFSLSAGMMARDAALEEGTHVLRGYWAIQSLSGRGAFGAEAGWERGIPLVVDKEADGGVRIAPFQPRSLAPLADHASERVNAYLATVAVQALKPSASLTAIQTLGLKGERVVHLREANKSVRLDSLERRAFFGKIDTAAKAEELVRLPYTGARVIKTESQYKAIVEALAAKGWKSPTHYTTTAPPGFGTRTRYIKGLGYLVEMLVLAKAAYDDRYGDIRYDVWAVTDDGKLGLTTATYVAAPLSDVGRPAKWKQPFPLDRAGYDALLRKELTTKGAEEIGPAVTVTKRVIRVYAPEGLREKDFQKVTP